MTAPPAILPASRSPAADPPALPQTFWQRFPNTLTLWFLLIAITALGAFLRYWRIDYQSLWADEWSTIKRVCGTYDDVLARLNGQGFPPGWYVALWYYLQKMGVYLGSPLHAFTIPVLRWFPALFGTLTIPAMYFLARGFTDRRGALLATLLTAVNPFLIYYARDLKMYAATYFFVTLFMALFLRWQQTRRHWLWWPLFTLTGCCMVIVNAPAWLIVGVQLIWLLTRPRLKALDAPLWLLTVGFMSLLPLWWYIHHTDWVDRVNEGADGGIGWNTAYTDMNWTTALSLPAVHVFGILVPSYPPDDRIIDWWELGEGFSKHLATRSYPWLASTEMWVLILFAALMFLALFPWRGLKPRWEIPTLTRYRGWWLAIWFALPMAALALTWIPPDSKWYPPFWRDHPVVSIWEPRYLGIVCPAFILLVALLLRRLPTWPLRTLAIISTLTLCTISALTSHFIYRQMPWQQMFADITPLVDKKNPDAVQVLSVHTRNSHGGDAAQLLSAMRDDPSEWDEDLLYYKYLRYRQAMGRPLTERDVARARNAVRNPDTKSLVLIDLDGDIPDGPMSDANLAKELPDFQLVTERHYRLHFEWRYYLFMDVRVRIWQRKKPQPTTAASTTRPAPTGPSLWRLLH